jgi:iron-sulfur cluster assembly protein
MMTATAF